MNKHRNCVYIIPEDDADRQVADGFVLHHSVQDAKIQVMSPAGGWAKALKTFEDEYVSMLRKYHTVHVVLLIDFDNQGNNRRDVFDQAIPADLKLRVFVVGSKRTPEILRNALKLPFESIGTSLAQDCQDGTDVFWSHEELRDNDAEKQRMVLAVKPFLFL